MVVAQCNIVLDNLVSTSEAYKMGCKCSLENNLLAPFVVQQVLGNNLGIVQELAS